ncbi:hypothetical protein CJ030_MR5G021942 [Morella rubra]|uniref:Uncharacterized protein n=1 Tax=Morella rubra TaxID=262757 RepID=A0A6A1VT24_9ROSI|nr:hypothetical protein CJ030_MR5G021942 [Morella rubra]
MTEIKDLCNFNMSLRYLSRIGVIVVEGLKDQGSKGLTRPPQSKIKFESDNSSQVRWFSGTMEPMKKVNHVAGKNKRLSCIEFHWRVYNSLIVLEHQLTHGPKSVESF